MRKGILIFVAVIVLLLPSIVKAQTIEASAVWGNKYNCFFYSLIDVFNSEISFGEQVSLSFSRFSGAGYYFSFANSFAGVYTSVDESIAGKNVDIVITLVGLTRQPFIFGTGTLIVNYTEMFPLFFQGMLVDQEL